MIWKNFFIFHKIVPYKKDNEPPFAAGQTAILQPLQKTRSLSYLFLFISVSPQKHLISKPSHCSL